MAPIHSTPIQWHVLIDYLNKMGDLDFQRDVWLHRKYGHPLAFMDEAANVLGDYYFYEAIKQRELPLNQEAYQFIDTYIKDLLAYVEPKDISVIFDDPLWLDITKRTRMVADIISEATDQDAPQPSIHQPFPVRQRSYTV